MPIIIISQTKDFTHGRLIQAHHLFECLIYQNFANRQIFTLFYLIFGKHTPLNKRNIQHIRHRIISSHRCHNKSEFITIIHIICVREIFEIRNNAVYWGVESNLLNTTLLFYSITSRCKIGVARASKNRGIYIVNIVTFIHCLHIVHLAQTNGKEYYSRDGAGHLHKQQTSLPEAVTIATTTKGTRELYVGK